MLTHREDKSPSRTAALIRSAVIAALFGLWPPLATASTPVSTYGTYFGGTGDTNAAVAVAVDPSGNVIMAGYTTSQTLPGTANAFQPTKATGFPDNRDVFVAKFDPTGARLLWATFLGGDGDDMPSAVAVDSSGNIYVAGTTQSSNFPVQVAVSCAPPDGFSFSTPFQQKCSTGAPQTLVSYSFVAKFASDGGRLLYAIQLPGNSPSALTVSRLGEAYVATSGLGVTGTDFLFRLNATGTGLIFSAFIAGGSTISTYGTRVSSLTIDSDGNCYVAGTITGGQLPTTGGAFQSADPNAGLQSGNTASGFIIKVNSAGSQALYGTYFGVRFSQTSITSMGVGIDGSLYFAGSTNTTSIQATPGAFLATPSPGFVAKLTPGSSVLDAFSYAPGSPLLEIGNQPTMLYAAFDTSFGTGGGAKFEVAELGVPTLGRASSFTPSVQNFAPSGAVLASPHALWLVGICESSCSLGNLISGNAFQTTPQSPSSSAVLIQITDESTNITAVVNAASYLSGPISPGEIVTLTGTGIGPTSPVGLALDQTGKVATSLGGAQVLFNGTPAPLTYVSATQINCVVPYEVKGLVNPYVQISYQGQTSSAYPLTAAPTVPALFTANGSGTGPAAAFNQDQSYNLPNSPAPKGSAVVLFITGEGLTSPSGITGKVTTVSATPPLTPQPLLPVSVLINGQPAFIAFYGEAPGLVSGVMQLNVQIPANARSGIVPLQVSVGGASTQSGVTVSVQ